MVLVQIQNKKQNKDSKTQIKLKKKQLKTSLCEAEKQKNLV